MNNHPGDVAVRCRQVRGLSVRADDPTTPQYTPSCENDLVVLALTRRGRAREMPAGWASVVGLWVVRTPLSMR